MQVTYRRAAAAVAVAPPQTLAQLLGLGDAADEPTRAASRRIGKAGWCCRWTLVVGRRNPRVVDRRRAALPPAPAAGRSSSIESSGSSSSDDGKIGKRRQHLRLAGRRVIVAARRLLLG